MPKKAFSKIWLLVIAAVIIAAGVLVWWQLQTPAEEEPASGEGQPPAEVEQPAADETANLPAEDSATEGWEIYRNEEYGFEVDYPVTGWEFEEHPSKMEFNPLFVACKALPQDEPLYRSEITCISGVVLGCADFNWDYKPPYRECDIRFGSGFESKKIETKSGEIGYMEDDSMYFLGYEGAGPIRFVVFLLKAKPEGRPQLLWLVYTTSPPSWQLSKEMDEIFDQMLSTFRFLE